MADSYALVSAALKTIIGTQFAAEGIVPLDDKLHESLGFDGTAVGISPISRAPNRRHQIIKETTVLVQFYGYWEKLVDPAQQVNPLTITGYADRFERAVETQQATSPGTTDVWYFVVEEITFLDDPTGNKTRFEAVVKAYGDNNALLQR